MKFSKIFLRLKTAFLVRYVYIMVMFAFSIPRAELSQMPVVITIVITVQST